MKKAVFFFSVIVISLVTLCFSAFAAESTVVIDNVVYELAETKTDGTFYAVVDFFNDQELSKTTKKITIVDEIDGIKVKGIEASSYDYPSVESISLPNTIEYIREHAFRGFTSVKELLLPSALKYIDQGCFLEMTNLESIVIPEGVTSISSYSFMNCDNLKNVVIKGNVTYIGDYAFASCEKLESIKLPDSLNTIGEDAFSATGLKKIEIPSYTTLYDYAFSGCDSLKKLVFKPGKEKKNAFISELAFKRSDNIEAVYLKDLPLNYSFPVLEGVKDIYFAGSPSLWEKSVSQSRRDYFEKNEIEVHFYYKHTHSFTRNGDPTCTKGGKFTYSCECGDTQTVTLAKNPDNHSYGSWKTVKKATYADYGTKQRTCKNCGKVQKAKIKKLVLGELKNLTATVNGNEATLSWDALEGATGYRVYIYDKEQYKNVKLASLKGKTTYTVSGLEAGETYFRIKPYNKTSDGKVTWAESVSVRVTVE